MSIHRQFTPLNTSAFPSDLWDMLHSPTHQKASLFPNSGWSRHAQFLGFPTCLASVEMPRPQELSLLATILVSGVRRCGSQHFPASASAMAPHHCTRFTDPGLSRPEGRADQMGRMFSHLEWLPSEPVFPKCTVLESEVPRHSFLADSGQSSRRPTSPVYSAISPAHLSLNTKDQE